MAERSAVGAEIAHERESARGNPQVVSAGEARSVREDRREPRLLRGQVNPSVHALKRTLVRKLSGERRETGNRTCLQKYEQTCGGDQRGTDAQIDGIPGANETADPAQAENSGVA